MKILLIVFTVIRLLIIPALFVSAFTDNEPLFKVSLISTVIIGLIYDIIARKSNLFTTSRSRLCSWADFTTFIVIIICAWILRYDLIKQEAIFLAVLLIGLFTPIIIGYVKYSRLTSYHTWMSRISLVFVASGAALLFQQDANWLFEFSTPLFIFAQMEEVSITAILPDWECNVPSLYHAVNLERQRAEQARIKAEEKLRTLLINIDDGYFELDLKGNLTFFNPTLCKKLGYTERELLGMNNREIMTEKMAKEAYQLFNQVYQTGKSSFGSDWTVITKKGEIRYFELSVSLLKNSNGESVGFRCIGRDLTERKNAAEAAQRHQEQLFQASKMVALGTLVSGVAHEINNPNNFIMLNAPILREAWEGMLPILNEYYEENGDFTLAGMDYSEMKEKIPLLLSGIEAGSNNILKIIQDLKEYVRKDSTGFDNNVDLNKVVKSALSLISNMIQKSTKNFIVNYNENIPCVKGNFQRLEQVVINLVQNACQSLTDMEKAVRLTTAFEKDRGQAVLLVEDEGIGIREENLATITEPFFTTKQDKDGLGLGLSITKRIIDEHGGKIIFKSREGKGTRIEVSLPVS